MMLTKTNECVTKRTTGGEEKKSTTNVDDDLRLSLFLDKLVPPIAAESLNRLTSMLWMCHCSVCASMQCSEPDEFLCGGTILNSSMLINAFMIKVSDVLYAVC